LEDLTDAREAVRVGDAEQRHWEMMLQEVHHRMANSLQIIGSILLLKARAVQSEDARLHLRDANRRLILVAAIQRQLRVAGFADAVAFGPYLDELCAALSDSMVDDQDSVSIQAS